MRMCAALFCLIFVAPIYAQQTNPAPAPGLAAQEKMTDQQLYAFNSVQEEYTRCEFYFRTLVTCSSSPPAMKEQAESQIGSTAKVFADTANAIGRKIGMTQDAMEQRLIRIAKEQAELTNNSACLNLDSLLARYAARCKELGEHPLNILEEYLRKWRSRQ
jgi:hypothetical protein